MHVKRGGSGRERLEEAEMLGYGQWYGRLGSIMGV